MRAKFIFEKFEEKSDPISDMSIGIKNLPLAKIISLTVDAFKPFGITVFFRTYDGRPGEIEFDLYDNVLQKEYSGIDFSFSNTEAAKHDFLGGEGGWFIEGVGMDDATYNLDDVVKIILNELYGDKEKVQARIKSLRNVIKYYEEN